MSVLYLALKKKYFGEIKFLRKKYEYRLYNDYWRKRIEGKTFSGIILTCGYPKKDDWNRRLHRDWHGYKIQWIKHPEFGTEAVKVFAIRVN